MNMFKPYQSGRGQMPSQQANPQMRNVMQQAYQMGFGNTMPPSPTQSNPRKFNFAEAEQGMQIQNPTNPMPPSPTQGNPRKFNFAEAEQGMQIQNPTNPMAGRSAWGGGGNDLVSQGMRQLQGMSPQQVQGLVSALAPDIQRAVAGSMNGGDGRFLKRR